MATAIAGPVELIIWNSPKAIDAMPTITVAALAVITAPMRLTVVRAASCQSPPPETSSR